MTRLLLMDFIVKEETGMARIKAEAKDLHKENQGGNVTVDHYLDMLWFSDDAKKDFTDLIAKIGRDEFTFTQQAHRDFVYRTLQYATSQKKLESIFVEFV